MTGESFSIKWVTAILMVFFEKFYWGLEASPIFFFPLFQDTMAWIHYYAKREKKMHEFLCLEAVLYMCYNACG